MNPLPDQAILKAQDHIVLVVADMDSAIAKWRDQFGIPLHHEVTLEEHGLRQAFFPLADGTFMELIAPTREDSRVAEILREKGEGIHVLALQVDDLESSVQQLKENGVELIGAGTERVFIHPDSANGVMIQLWPKDRPHRWRD
jgi:methylmalonyl-CoA epimerase